MYSNSVVFYINNEPIYEITNINMDSNIDLISLIEDRLNDMVKKNRYLKRKIGM